MNFFSFFTIFIFLNSLLFGIFDESRDRLPEPGSPPYSICADDKNKDKDKQRLPEEPIKLPMPGDPPY